MKQMNTGIKIPIIRAGTMVTKCEYPNIVWIFIFNFIIN